jgi:hypothetical protein
MKWERFFTTRNGDLAMKSPSNLPWWTPLPAPVFWGVMVSWIPLSVPVMAGLAFGTAAYVGLNMLMEREQAQQMT